jgi:hypothetical protein
MIENIEQLFRHYIKAFQAYDIASARACYHVPCTLHTPDNVVHIADEQGFIREFEDIFAMLQHANICDFKVLSASYTRVSDTIILACVDWQFLNQQEKSQKPEVFTDFSAFYHIGLFNGQRKIFNVVSQELSQSTKLNTIFLDKITQENN